MTNRGSSGYRGIGEYYEHLIRTGQLSPGEMLPTEAELAGKHAVTRTTIRRAFAMLVNKGLVLKKQGRGSFVAQAADVESRARSHVVIAAPRTLTALPPAGVYTEDIRYHDGLYQFMESFIIALASFGRPFRIHYYGEDEQSLRGLGETARKNGDVGVIIFDVEKGETIDLLTSFGMPVVFVDCAMHGRKADLVKADNFEGERVAALHLLGTTAGPLAFVGAVGARDEGSPHKERLDGFRAAHRETGRAAGEDYVALGSVTASTGRNAVRRMLALAPAPTGYVCSDDDIACGVLDELRERGIPVPSRVSVVGFGDTCYSRTTVPNLSSVAMDRRTMGMRAVDLLNARLEKPTGEPVETSVPVHVVLRHTTVVVPPTGMPPADAKA